MINRNTLKRLYTKPFKLSANPPRAIIQQPRGGICTILPLETQIIFPAHVVEVILEWLWPNEWDRYRQFSIR
jgi:hypothetical protein